MLKSYVNLGIAAATNNWAADTDVSAAASELTTALVTLRSQAQALSSNLQTVQIRQEFTKAMISTSNNSEKASSNTQATLKAVNTSNQHYAWLCGACVGAG